jgi:hypothetical protein
MQHVHLDQLNVRSAVFVLLALVAGVFMFRATKHLLFGLFFTTVALAIVAWGFDIVTLEDAKAAAAAIKADAGEGFDAASLRAKAIGEQGYNTSAGKGGQVNGAYERHVEGK